MHCSNYIITTQLHEHELARKPEASRSLADIRSSSQSEEVIRVCGRFRAVVGITERRAAALQRVLTKQIGRKSKSVERVFNNSEVNLRREHSSWTTIECINPATSDSVASTYSSTYNIVLYLLYGKIGLQ